MKLGNNYLRLLAAFALGFLIAAGLFAMRSKQSARNEGVVYSEIAASLGKNVVTLNRLNSNDIFGAKFVLETSLDGGIMALHFREAEAPLDESQRKVLEVAKEYRRNHPFVSTNYGVPRGEGVEELVNRITRK
jgi:hypothetical protein